MKEMPQQLDEVMGGKSIVDTDIEGNTNEVEPASDSNLEKPLNEAEQVSKKIEFIAEKLGSEVGDSEQLLKSLTNLEELSGAEEESHIAEKLEKNNLPQKLIEVLGRVMHAQEHAIHQLDGKYDPRVLKTVGLIGKVLGGMGGLTAGMTFGGLPGGAIAAVAGSKGGGYSAIRVFDRLAEKLPQRFKEKFMPKTLENQEGNESIEDSIENQIEKNTETMQRIDAKINQINALPLEKRHRIWEKFASNPKTADIAERINLTAGKYKEVWHAFEKKYPHAAVGLELTTHMGIPLMTKGMLDPIIVEKIILGLEYALSAGVSEEITAAITAKLKSAKDHLFGMRDTRNLENN